MHVIRIGLCVVLMVLLGTGSVTQEVNNTVIVAGGELGSTFFFPLQLSKPVPLIIFLLSFFLSHTFACTPLPPSHKFAHIRTRAHIHTNKISH